MSAQDFLVELGTEELPPKALASLGDAFLAGIEKGLQAAGLNYAGKQVYAAPRRLAVLIRQLDVQQPDRSINIDGPPLQAAFNAEGEPTQAALGFAKKCGVELAEIDQSGPKLRYSQSIAGKPTASLLPTIVEDSLNDLPIPKRMRWAVILSTASTMATRRRASASATVRASALACRDEAVEEGGGAGYRVEALHEACPCACPVLFAKIGGQRAPEARLDPPLRLLPVVAIIVAQALVIGRRHPGRGQALGERLVRAHLAVGDHAVEIENDRGETHGNPTIFILPA